MKKKLILAVALSCLIAIFAFSANAEIVEKGACGANLTWTLDDLGTLTISGTGNMTDYNNNGAPWQSLSVNYVIIEDGITSIGNYAFSRMTSLERIKIGNSVTKIGNSAFYGSSNLIKVVIPDTVKLIGEGAFNNCTFLVSVNIPSGVERIEAYTFYKCDSLTSIKLPSSVKSIGAYSFCWCNKLTEISIPYGVEIIPSSAFALCQNLKSAELPPTVTAIANNAFSSSLNTVYFGGTKEQWDEIIIGNSLLEKVSVTFIEMEKPVLPTETAKEPCILVYNANGGMEPPSPVTTESGASVTVSSEILTRENYEFLGWAKTSDAATPEYKGGGTITITENTTLYAVWKKTGSFDTQMILTIGEAAANVNGKTMYNDVAPIIENSRTMLPARFVAENLGATVSWNDAEKKVTIKNDTITIDIIIGSATAYVNGEAKTLDSPAFIRNSRTYTPVRFICESLGAKVEWNEAQQSVIVTK